MNRFLDNLAARLLNSAEAIQPRTPSRFEPEAAASPRPHFAPETVWEEAEGLEPSAPHFPETVRPEQDSAHRPLSRRAPMEPSLPSALSENAAAAPPAPAQAARASVSTNAPTPVPILRLPETVRDEAKADTPRLPAAPSISSVRPVRQAPDKEPMTATDGLGDELRAVPTPALLSTAGTTRGGPVSPASGRAEGQEASEDTAYAQLGGQAPLSPALSSEPFSGPVRVPAPVVSSEAALPPSGAISVEAVTTESGASQTQPETPGRRPAAVVVRAASAPATSLPDAKPSEPEAQETPPAPTIQVTIGRIEVRAAPAPRASNARPTPPKLTLQEYLRDGGRK